MYQRTELIGNIGRDPETKTLPSGTPVTNVSVATNEKWTDKTTGEKKEKTVWFRLAFFGKAAENAAQYCRKGGRLFAAGTIESRAYMGEDGEPRATLELRVSEWKLLGSSNGAAREGGVSNYEEYGTPPDNVDDIPF